MRPFNDHTTPEQRRTPKKSGDWHDLITLAVTVLVFIIGLIVVNAV